MLSKKLQIKKEMGRKLARLILVYFPSIWQVELRQTVKTTVMTAFPLEEYCFVVILGLRIIV